MRPRFLRKRSDRKGAAALEFALTAPMVFFVILTCFEFGKLAMMKSMANTAAYEGARYAVVEGSVTQDAVDEANRILARMGTQNATVTVNDGAGISTTDAAVTVTITIPMEDNAFLLSGVFAGRNIVKEVTLTTERYTGYYSGE